MSSTNVVSFASDNAEIAALISDINKLYTRGRAYRLAMGRKLIELRKLLSKPGYGSFMKTVREQLNLAYTTAVDYIKEAEAADCLDEIRNDEPASCESDDEIVDAIFDDDPDTPDPVVEAIQKEAKVLSFAAANAESSTDRREFNWKFQNLTPEMNEQIKAAKRLLTQKQAINALLTAAAEVRNATIAA